MKKRTLSIITILFSLCLLIFACRREINNFVKLDQPNVSADLLESAKIWNAQVIAQNAAFNAKTKDFITLKPQWNDSWTLYSKEGLKLIVVPTIENHVSNRSVSIRRVFVFESVDNQIASGRIIEFIGLNYAVNPNLENLLKNFHSKSIEGFNGAIVQYDLNYRWSEGKIYENGNEKYDNAIISKSAKGTELYLSLLSRDAGGNPVYKEQTYLYTINNKLSVQDTGGSGSGSGNESGGSMLSEVVIIGNPPSGGGGGGGTGGNPPGGGTGGGSGGTGGGSGGNTVAVTFANKAVLCGGVTATTTGNANTGGVSNLGFYMYATPPGGSTQNIQVVWGITCFSIPNYSPTLNTPAQAALAFEAAYNGAVSFVIGEVKANLIPLNSVSIQSALKAQIILLLNTAQTGSTFSTGPCSNITATPAIYCN